MIKALFALTLLGLLSFGVYSPSLHAQEDSELSEEEIALVERFAEIVATEDTAPAYSVYIGETNDIQLNLTLDDEDYFYQNYFHNIFQGSVVRTDEFENSSGSLSSKVTIIAPEAEPADFTLYFDVVFVDDILYAQVTFTEGEEPEYPEGWQTYTSAEEISPVFTDTALTRFFDETDSPLDDAEFLLSVVDSVTTETTEDGHEIIEMTVAPDKFDEFFAGMSEEENNAFVEILTQENGEGNLTLKVDLNTEDNSFFVDVILSYWFEDVATEDTGIQDLPEGGLLDLEISLVASNWITSFTPEEEIEPIVAPDLEATAE